MYFPNGSDHAMIACYLELYEEGKVSHINGVWPISKHYCLLVVQFFEVRTVNSLRMHRNCPINTLPQGHTSTFERKQAWVGGTIDMLIPPSQIACNHCMI